MVDLCPVVKWSSIWMVVWKPDWKSLFMVKNVQFSNGPPSHVILSFGHPVFWCLIFRWLLYSEDLNTDHLNTGKIWIPETFKNQIFWGSDFKWLVYVLWTRPTLQMPDQYKRKQDGVLLFWYSIGLAVLYSNGIQILEQLASNLHTGPFGIQPLIYHVNTKLVWYSDPHCPKHQKFKYPFFRWLSYRLSHMARSAYQNIQITAHCSDHAFKTNSGKAGSRLEVRCRGKYQSFVT